MATQVNPNGHTPPATFTEAPASATIRVTSPSGLEWMLTTRAATMRDLIAQVTTLETWLTGNHWTPTATRPAPALPTNGASSDFTDAPICPTHGKPMKQGQRGGWYCPVKIAEDDGTGKPVYCKQRK